MDETIFKSYDIRGIFPSTLNERVAYAVGRAFITHTGAKRVVICQDARVSSPALFKALAEGIISEGADIYTIGQLPTECLYFAVNSYDFDAGIMITASHNPKEYNGFKMMTKNGKEVEWVRGKDLLPIIKETAYEEISEEKIHKKDVLDDYITYASKFLGETKRFKVVVDASNGVMGSVLSKMTSSLPVEIIELNFRPDGNFPNHSPNPLEEGASLQIAQKIKEEKADFGVMFDADADRIFLVDEQGSLVSSDVTRLLLAKYMLQKYSGAKIVHDLICSRAVPEYIKKWGGIPIKSQVGFVNIREALLKNNGVMGSEVSGHYCYKDYFNMDSALVSFFILLQSIAKEGKAVSEIAKDLSLYAKAPVISFKVEDQRVILDAIKKHYADGKQDSMDGITIEYSDWWCNVRPSNTEPFLKLTVEADTQELLDRKIKELSEFFT